MPIAVRVITCDKSGYYESGVLARTKRSIAHAGQCHREKLVGAALYPWQEAEAQYVKQIAFVFDLMKDGIERYCKGLEGRTVLEIGTAHQRPMVA